MQDVTKRWQDLHHLLFDCRRGSRIEGARPFQQLVSKKIK